MKWITLYFPIICFSAIEAEICDDVLTRCEEQYPIKWTGCYEDKITNCTPVGRIQGFIQMEVNSSNQVEVSPTFSHRVRVPSSALQRSRGAQSEENVLLTVSVINSSFFQKRPHSGAERPITQQPVNRQPTVLNGEVLFLKAGSQPVSNLSEPVQAIFGHEKMKKNGRCVFWKESNRADEPGQWSTEGCRTEKTEEEFICSCNRLRFFAVLVNQDLEVDESNAKVLGYITYIGSALSAFFAFSSLFIFVHLQMK